MEMRWIKQRKRRSANGKGKARILALAAAASAQAVLSAHDGDDVDAVIIRHKRRLDLENELAVARSKK